MKKVKQWIISITLVLVMMVVPAGESMLVTANAETMVYVTRTGSKYHTHKCGNGTYYQTTLSAALARGLTPCKKCFGSSSGYATSGSSTKKTTEKKQTAKPKVSALKISTTNVVLVKGQEKKLKIKGGAGTTHWSSSNTAVAKVSGSGTVAAKAKGNAVITVTRGSQKKTCKVKVETPELNQSELKLQVSDEATLKLKGCSHEVEWYSSDDSVCSVEDGELMAWESGKVTIKAKAHGVVFKCKVVVAA